jgi:hypothetical protein
MPKTKTVKTPKDWQPFPLADGTTRYLPNWALAPLEFNISPDEALLKCAHTRLPKSRKKSVKTRLKS